MNLFRKFALVFAGMATFFAPAAVLPANATPAITLYTVSNSGQLYSLNPSSGAETAIGTGTGLTNPASMSYNRINKKVYVMNYDCTLSTIDLTSGLAESTGITLAGTTSGGPATYCESMTIDKNGKGLISFDATSSHHYFGNFNLSTGVITALSTTENYYDWIAIDPRNGTVYAQNDDDPLYTVNPSTGVETLLNQGMQQYSYAVIIDSAGKFWANDWNNLNFGQVSDWTSSTVGALAGPVQGPTLFTTTDLYPAATTTSNLANTGGDSTPYLLLGFALILGGLFVRRLAK